MSSLFSMLNIGSRGLSAAQTELDLVGQNITNADTEGYSRKRATLSTGVQTDSVLGQTSYGVDVVNVQRMRDTLLDRQMQSVATELGERTQTDTDLQEIEYVLTEPSDSGLNTFLDDFWAAWQDLANDPSDSTARQAVLDAGSALTGRFNDIGEQFNSLIETKNDEIAAAAGEINTLLEGIAADNKTIASAESGGLRTNANDTRDQREEKLKELSELIDISYTEDAQGRYIITSSGNMLVSASEAKTLTVERSAYTLSDGSQVSRATLTLASTHEEFEPAGGSLKALYTARDETIPHYQEQIDDYARQLVEAVNAQHQEGYDLAGTTGTNFFDPDTTGASDIDLSATVKAGTNYLAAAYGGSSTGLSSPLNLTVPAAGTPLDIASTVNSNYRNFSQGSVVVSTVGPPAVTLEEGAGKDYTVDYAGGTIVFNNAASVTPGTAITVDFRYTTTDYNGEGDGKNALKIAQIAQLKISKPDQFGTATATLGDAYATTVGELGSAKSTAESALTTTTDLNDYLQTQIDEVSGVSMDEELANMVKFQNSYQSAARYMSTVSTLMDTLLGIGA